ncbi:Type I restriction enzyme EcoKI specificity protein [Serratia liquefaciens]|jgi:type I restriction enzyme, S subunit|uniref:restriction endonuclease subunit S n=1 Tax=Serratia liquefaciens TaxID=614 RepID=UPI0021776F52|nr:restriction endonuclease subunit S [Serratia liquefaciens]CAI1038701.1 Type I restriction enzyme EcoKI specificity protein [Serratia liquefaciens]CAI1092919.1 Type I restriction enzyme EcoKI specificity protein [Serratia liquefaciens]
MAKYKAYPEYKDSGVEWLGEIPRHWVCTQIKYGYDVTLGKMLQKNKSSFKDELKPYLKAQNIQPTGVDLNIVDLMWFSPEEQTKLLLKPNDVLISEGGDVGRSTIWLEQLDECYIQNAINRVRAIKGNSSSFLNYWMIYLKSADFINTLCNKATIAHYTAEKVEMSPVLLPTSNEQLLISAFLDHETAKIDNLIEKQKQLIELLKEKRQAVISHAVTKGITPDVPMKDSGVEWLGEVPEHWDIPKLLHVTRTIGDGLHSTPEYDNETGYYFINGNNLVNGKISIGVTAKEVSKSEYNKHYVHLDEASVLLSINGTIGNVAVYNNERIILGKSAAYVKCGDKLNVNYLMYCFITDEARYYFDLEVTGTTIFNLSLNSIRQMKVCIPPLEEQKLIIDYCFAQENKYNYLIHSADTAIKLMQERRTALISAAVTGKIDVRNWVAPEAKKAEVSQEATA